ncbi:MAG: DUF6600 domain-containing protein [Duganella sp.]
MSRKIIPTVLLAVLAGFSSSTTAYAQDDLPAAVGRISAAQGQVTLSGQDEPVAVSLNWPVTAGSHLTTASGGRTEFRIGSTAVRLDADSDLEITELDDDLLRLRLNYGSVSIRVRNQELLRDFELATPQARITMIEPGLLRVDVDRVPDTSLVAVLAGAARVDGAGSSVTVTAGRQVDVTSQDVRTSVARRDGFDVWSDERDRVSETVISTRYVSSGMTGYEELDRNGSWTESVDYGPLWAPRTVAADWAPYRDGRWTWLAPWGWTWVDNAPWGYAPSHYGRWVNVRQRWFWAPGRPTGRPVWAPALVGWVGGVNHPGHGPGLGWYPLTPRDRFVPGYRVSSSYEQRLGWTYQGKPFAPRGGKDDRRDHRTGLTVLPRAQFEGRNTVRVNRGDQFVPRPQQANLATPATPPSRPGGPGRIGTGRPGLADRNGDGRPDRFETNRPGGPDRNGDGRPDRIETNRPGGPDRNGDGRPDRIETNRPGLADRNGDGRPDRFEQGRGDHRQPGPVIGTGPAQLPPQNGQLPQNAPQQGGQRPGRPQVIGTLPPNQVGTPDAPAQTINPRDVGIELHNRPQVGRPGNGAAMPAPVLQIGPTRDRFQRDDDDRNPGGREEQRHWLNRRPQQQAPQQPQQAQQAQQAQQQSQQQQPAPQQPQRPQAQPERPPQHERPQQQDRPQFRPDRPQPQDRPQSRPERPQQQERPQPQPQAQPAPPPRPAPAAQPQPQSQPQPQQREPGNGRQGQRERPTHDQR